MDIKRRNYLRLSYFEVTLRKNFHITYINNVINSKWLSNKKARCTWKISLGKIRFLIVPLWLSGTYSIIKFKNVVT